MKLELFGISLFTLAVAITPVLAKNDPVKSLPPGLQKKVQEGKTLPPGWQKKLRKGEILDARVYENSIRVYPADRNGLITVHADGRIIRVMEATREIIEILK